MKNGPIILIEDDLDDQELIVDSLQSLKVNNPLEIFDNGRDALHFLKNTDTKPFLIISDVNLPFMNGLQLKAEIENNEYLRSKSIPFIFLSTSADKKAVDEAFKLAAQGFFVKENSIDAIQQQLKQIIEYWSRSKHPNSKELSF